MFTKAFGMLPLGDGKEKEVTEKQPLVDSKQGIEVTSLVDGKHEEATELLPPHDGTEWADYIIHTRECVPGEWVALPPGVTYTRFTPVNEHREEPEPARLCRADRLFIAACLFTVATALVMVFLMAQDVFLPGVSCLVPALCPSSTIVAEFKPTAQFSTDLASTATQLTSLHDGFSQRMAQHHVVMNNNLDNFTAILTCITTDADLAVSYAELIQNLFPLTAGSTSEEWQTNTDLLITEAEKLSKLALSDDVRNNIEAVAQIAANIAVEMKDMEVFMKDANDETNAMLKKLGMIVAS